MSNSHTAPKLLYKYSCLKNHGNILAAAEYVSRINRDIAANKVPAC